MTTAATTMNLCKACWHVTDSDYCPGCGAGEHNRGSNSPFLTDLTRDDICADWRNIMTNQHARQLEDFVAALDDADAWDALARLGWQLIDRTLGVETWERDGATVRRALTSGRRVA